VKLAAAQRDAKTSQDSVSEEHQRRIDQLQLQLDQERRVRPVR
jgi:hypothetical protein